MLSRLVKTVSQSLKEELPLQETVCYTDSKIALFWIYGLDRDWKPFVQNRTEEIRRLVPHLNGDTVLAREIQLTSHLEGAPYQN